jgi:dihydroorotase-like cyclic amidohydrolase
MSGIATATAAMVEAVAGTNTRCARAAAPGGCGTVVLMPAASPMPAARA